MKTRIVGMGCVSSLGVGVGENLRKLREEQTGIARRHIFHQDLYIGALDKSNSEIKAELQLDETDFVSRSTLLGILAAREALNGVSISNGRTAFINGMTVGGMDLTETILTVTDSVKDAPVEIFATHDLGTITRSIAEYLGGFDYLSSVSTACSSGANAILNGQRLINAGLFDRVVVGGVDSLSEFTTRGFQSLMLYSDELCRPFNEERNGLNLGEGAAYLVLESEECNQNSGNPTLAYLLGGGNANDSHHITASSPEGKGAQLAIEKALKMAGISPADIDYINAHGTSTRNNDDSESAAVVNLFGEELPQMSSTKSYTGHTLAACGAIEAVYSILAIQNNLVFPTLHSPNPILPESSFPMKLAERDVKVVMSNSFGFGGNSTSLIFGES